MTLYYEQWLYGLEEFNQYHKHQMGTHHRDPMEDYNHSCAHDICHIDYKNHSIVTVHSLHSLSLAV